VRSCVIDGEAIVTDDKGLAVFELIRGHGTRRGAELCAFDLIELDGKDIRHTPIEERKRHLGKLLGRYQPGIVVNEFFEGDAQIIFDHVCKLGCEGNRIKAARFAISGRQIGGLGQGQEPRDRRYGGSLKKDWA
jgi:bifunctional non-homologous end joining protein LigD